MKDKLKARDGRNIRIPREMAEALDYLAAKNGRTLWGQTIRVVEAGLKAVGRDG